ncbi:MAG: hypothetical protein FWB72_01155 [Firmicutes bacterium]|nr:hypothetical protein [Bacillota bacterium]
MRKKLKILLVSLLALSMAFVMFACDDNGNGNGTGGGNGGGPEDIDFDLGEAGAALTTDRTAELLDNWLEKVESATLESIRSFNFSSLFTELSDGAFRTEESETFVANNGIGFAERIFTYDRVSNPYIIQTSTYFYNNSRFVHAHTKWFDTLGGIMENESESKSVYQLWYSLDFLFGFCCCDFYADIVGRSYANGYAIVLSYEYEDNFSSFIKTLVFDNQGYLVGISYYRTHAYECYWESVIIERKFTRTTNIVWGGNPAVPTPDVSLWA